MKCRPYNICGGKSLSTLSLVTRPVHKVKILVLIYRYAMVYGPKANNTIFLFIRFIVCTCVYTHRSFDGFSSPPVFIHLSNVRKIIKAAGVETLLFEGWTVYSYRFTYAAGPLPPPHERVVIEYKTKSKK